VASANTPIIGIAGWKNSGKTTLVVRLVEEFTSRGFRIATVKHAHHAFQIDEGETDSARHRCAGASEVAIGGAERWAIVHELHEEPEPDFAAVIARLSPADLILVEGYKSAPIRKIEARRSDSVSQRPLAVTDPHVIAIAADHSVEGVAVPVFDLNDVAAIASFIQKTLGVTSRAATVAGQRP